jgi:hypothetical protein
MFTSIILFCILLLTICVKSHCQKVKKCYFSIGFRQTVTDNRKIYYSITEFTFSHQCLEGQVNGIIRQYYIHNKCIFCYNTCIKVYACIDVFEDLKLAHIC